MLDKQMKIFQEGGMMDNSGEVVNGTEVPTGSLRKEVADDIPARLSEGEFVIPADVVRFIGLEKLMKMRDAAKAGLARMEEMGQMGNAQEVQNPDQMFSEEMPEGNEDTSQFEADIDEIMNEVDGEQTFSLGGMASGTDLSRAPKNPAIDVRYFKTDEGDNSRSMYITFINGRPMTPIPDGFKEVTQEEARNITTKEEEAPVEKATTGSSVLQQEGGEGDFGADGEDAGTGDDGMGSGPPGTTGSVDPLGLAINVATLGPILGTIASVVDAQMHNPQAVPVTDAMLGLDVSNVANTGVGVNAQGQTVSNTDTIAQQNAALFGVEPNDPTYGVPSATGNTGIAATNAAGITSAQNAAISAMSPAGIGSVGGGADGGAGVGNGVGGATDSGEGVGAAPSGDAAASAGVSASGEGEASDGNDWAKGGLINKRKRPAKKQTKKGIAAKK